MTVTLTQECVTRFKGMNAHTASRLQRRFDQVITSAVIEAHGAMLQLHLF